MNRSLQHIITLQERTPNPVLPEVVWLQVMNIDRDGSAMSYSRFGNKNNYSRLRSVVWQD
ncbi:hypothetical protein [Taibaiella koreensis]|uniref:hypothetical protein n=1 Tax=Taibaiella koreensis TaxID=1268548 RepID=UPI0013C33464|nr:hypothetical protein [Taibaiella koreensis]